MSESPSVTMERPTVPSVTVQQATVRAEQAARRALADGLTTEQAQDMYRIAYACALEELTR